MTPEVAALGRAITRAGEDVILRRVAGSPGAPVNVDVALRAHVRWSGGDELAGGLRQRDGKVIISPAEIARAQWPGGEPPGWLTDRSVPVAQTDRLIIQGRTYAVREANPVIVGGTLARIEIMVRG